MVVRGAIGGESAWKTGGRKAENGRKWRKMAENGRKWQKIVFTTTVDSRRAPDIAEELASTDLNRSAYHNNYSRTGVKSM